MRGRRDEEPYQGRPWTGEGECELLLPLLVGVGGMDGRKGGPKGGPFHVKQAETRVSSVSRETGPAVTGETGALSDSGGGIPYGRWKVPECRPY